MIDYLMDLGLVKEDIEIITKEVNIDNLDILKLNIDILRSIGISDNSIKNIVVTNISIFNNDPRETLELIEKFKIYKFNDLDSLFSKNPFILNMTSYELGLFINSKLDEGLTIEEVIDIIENDPFIMD